MPSKKLLVADDSVTIQKVIKLALSSEGYDILAVSEGKEAIRAIQEERPSVVLIDIALPGANAYEVKRAINQNPDLSNIGFILMASAFEKVDERAAEEARFQARLIKPFDPAHLRKSVAQLMEKSETIQKTSPVSSPDLTPVTTLHPEVQEQDLSIEMTNTNLDAPESPESEDAVAEATQERQLESDIRNLTESTIKMSGLDEFQWNLDDSKKMKMPPPHPPNAASTPEVTRPIPMERKTGPIIVPPARSLDDGGSNFLTIGLQSKQSKGPTPPPPPMRPEISNIPEPQDVPVSAAPMSADIPTIEIKTEPKIEATVAPVSRAEIEEMIRRDLHAAIEKLARDTVVQMAETVIRKEIERILAEP